MKTAEIDWRKLIEQEPEFKAYVAAVILDLYLDRPQDVSATLRLIHEHFQQQIPADATAYSIRTIGR